eukprot:2504699-Karenia_brevis.AAC.1
MWHNWANYQPRRSFNGGGWSIYSTTSYTIGPVTFAEDARTTGTPRGISSESGGKGREPSPDQGTGAGDREAWTSSIPGQNFVNSEFFAASA